MAGRGRLRNPPAHLGTRRRAETHPPTSTARIRSLRPHVIRGLIATRRFHVQQLFTALHINRTVVLSSFKLR